MQRKGDSQSQFARFVGLSRSGVAKAVSTGRLVLHDDGSIDREASLVRWRAMTDPAKQRDHLRRHSEPAPASMRVRTAGGAARPDTDAAWRVAREVGQRAFIGLAATYAAMLVDCGCPLRVVYAATTWAELVLAELLERVWQEMRLGPFADPDTIPEVSWIPGDQVRAVDWAALAIRSGEPYDENAWRSYADAINARLDATQ